MQCEATRGDDDDGRAGVPAAAVQCSAVVVLRAVSEGGLGGWCGCVPAAEWLRECWMLGRDA